MNNPRWTRFPFKGWREDTAASFIGLMLWLVLIASIAATGCTQLGGIVWPTTVKCLAMPSAALIEKVRVIVEQDGIAGVFSDAAVKALEDLARQYGPEAIVCVLHELIDAYTAPTGMQASPEAIARSSRAQNFLNEHEIVVQQPPE